MVMGLRTAIVPLALYLGGAAAFNADFAWHEARQTDGDLAKMAGIVPLATAAPEPGLLQKRGTNTCGFIDGDARQGITCRADLGAECLYDSTASAIGCCATTSCSIWTACLPFTSSDATSTVDLERTRYCSNSALPHCAVYKFEDPVWTGYTIAVCDSVSSTYSFYPSPLGVTTTSSRGRTTTTSTTSETSTSSRTSTSPGPTTTTSEPSGGGAPVGAIVGGVIGGLAVLALFAVGLFFILRRLKQKGNNNVPPTAPPMMAAAVPPPGPQAPPQQPYTPDPMKPQMYAGAPSSVPSMYGPPTGGPDGQAGGFYYNQPPVDNRMSMASATPISPTSYAPSVAGGAIAGGAVGLGAGYAAGNMAHPGQSPSPSGPEYNNYAQPPQYPQPSPPLNQPQGQTSPVLNTYAPPPQQGGYPQGAYPPAAAPYPQGGYAPGPGQHAPAELPTSRPDGELRELA